jgi:glucosyl-dolichyl phosphate glucuronosyltransferase
MLNPSILSEPGGNSRANDGTNMDVSIAICTRNRAVSLARTLKSLTAMSVPDGLDWEIVVVNNASSDNTDAVIFCFQSQLPLQRQFEAAPGLSNARNRAVAAAKGAYVVWTDDDVVVDRCWLGAYVEAFRSWPDAALFGGKIIPLFEEPMPYWLRECWPMVGNAYALREFGDKTVPIVASCLPYGANFAVRTVEQRIYSYNPALGVGAPVPTEATIGDKGGDLHFSIAPGSPAVCLSFSADRVGSRDS